MDGLRTVKARDGIPVSEQLRRAIEMWLETKGVEMKTARRRTSQRRRA